MLLAQVHLELAVFFEKGDTFSLPTVIDQVIRELVSIILGIFEKLRSLLKQISAFVDICEWCCLVLVDKILVGFELKNVGREMKMDELDHSLALDFHELVVVRRALDGVLGHQLILGLVSA